MFARVIVDINHEQVNQVYDYRIPDAFLNLVTVGARVSVPFGNQVRVAFIYELTHESQQATKEIIDVLDVYPIMTDELFLIKSYLSSFNDKTDAKLISTMISTEQMFSYRQMYQTTQNHQLDPSLSPFIKDGYVTLPNDALKLKRKLKQAIDLGYVKVIKTYEQKGKPKTELEVTIGDLSIPLKTQDLDFVDELKNQLPKSRSELRAQGYSVSKMNRLIKTGVLKLIEKRIYRLPDYDVDPSIKKIEILNADQEKAYQKARDTKKDISLLYGVTASGKTEVYIRLMRDAIKQNKQVLFLVPDIALIYQVYQRLILETGFDVVLYHSGLSKGMRFDTIEAIKTNRANVLLGTRSASFLSFKALGLIIMDEAHDPLYLQEDDVFYDTFEVIKIKASYHQAKIILGSATPSVSHFFEAKSGKYELLTLPKKAVNKSYPRLEVVDMKAELKSGNTTILSKTLLNKIHEKLEKDEQVLILFNQKGYAPFVMCRQCGHVPKDPQTGLSLLYDKKHHILRSRQTKYQEPYQLKCPICGSEALRPVGIGIEYVYEYLQKVFKDTKIAKLDRDVLTKKGHYEQLVSDFKNKKIDILVGTQMISKGLDFKDVTLSVILMADTYFQVPSYLSSEQAYMTFTQMIGRSARHLEGDAIVQTYSTDHYVIKTLDKKYEDFYKEAIFEREIRQLEPFFKSYQVAFYGNHYLKTYQYAMLFMKRFDRAFALGPSEVFYKKLNYNFGFVVTLKFKPDDTVDFKASFQEVPTDIFIAVKSIHQIL